MKASTYQQTIYDFIENGKGNAIINAVAGSGKTTTIVNGCKLIPKHLKTKFLAFNKPIATELSSRLPSNVECSTIHSSCYSVVRNYLNRKNTRNWIKDDKYTKIKDELMFGKGFDPTKDKTKYEAVGNAIDKARLTLTMPMLGDDATLNPEFAVMCQKYDVEYFPGIENLVNTCLEKGYQDAFNCIDFTDMLWLVIKANLKMPKYDWLLVDECQDLSACQREVLLKMIDPTTTRVIAVGDPSQQIYGFIGADTNSFYNLKEALNFGHGVVELPLSVCYRCPKSVIELAKAYVPSISSPENAEEGIVEYRLTKEVQELASKNDLILCRKNAPLVKWVFQFISKGIPAKIKGRDIIKGLMSMALSINEPGYKWSEFGDLLEIYRDRKLNQFAEEKTSDSYVEGFLDRLEALKAMYEFSLEKECASFSMFRDMTKNIFSDDEENVVWLSSIHRAKGLEADRVFILESTPVKTRTEDDVKQEENLKYVAITRAKKTLFFLSDKEADIVQTSPVGNEEKGELKLIGIDPAEPGKDKTIYHVVNSENETVETVEYGFKIDTRILEELNR